MVEHTFASLATETVVLTVLYHVVAFRWFRGYLEKRFQKEQWWDTLAATEGQGMSDDAVQREVIYGSILTLHHCTGGLFLTVGYLFNAPEIFVHGITIELADDIHDTAILLLREWPFFKNKSNARLATFMIPHHLFGMLLGIPTVLQGHYKNPNVQAMSAAMLMAGGVSLFVLTLNRTRDRTNPIQAWQEVFVSQLNFWVFVYCRFYVFPVRMYRFLFVDGVLERMPAETKLLMIIGVSMMTFFNVAVFLDMTSKMGKNFRKAAESGSAAKALGYTLTSLEMYFAKQYKQLKRDSKNFVKQVKEATDTVEKDFKSFQGMLGMKPVTTGKDD